MLITVDAAIPSKVSKCKQCGKLIAEPKGVIRIMSMERFKVKKLSLLLMAIMEKKTKEKGIYYFRNNFLL